MAITYSLAAVGGNACTPTTATSSFLARINAIDATAVVTTSVAGTATQCSATTDLCCALTKMDAIVNAQVSKIKTSFTTFGGKIASIGANMAKIGALVNATAIGTSTPSATLSAATGTDLSGATAAQFAAFGNYTPTAYAADYASFASALPDCFTKYSELIQKLACDGCNNVAVPTRYAVATANTNSFWLAKASISAIALKCTKVWNFMWKTGWFVQTVAYLNSKKATGYTYSPLTIDKYFYQSGLTTGTAPPATTIDSINLAFTNCAADPTVTGCTDTNKAVLVQAFVEVYGLDASLGVGRANTAIIATTYVSNARRMLVANVIDGSVIVATTDTDGLDTTATTAVMWTPTGIVTLTAAADMGAWSAGYVAPSTTTTTSSSSTTTKNAKVVIGTILSAIFAIAFLN